MENKLIDHSKMKSIVEGLIAAIKKSMVGIFNEHELIDITIEYDTFYEIAKFVEEKRSYFSVFHQVQICELKECSIICYWILKLMPFKHDSITNSKLNTKIAFSFFTRILFFVAESNNKKKHLDENTLKYLMYAFQYKDLDADAIFAIAQGFLS
ncbi:MAG: hypothetical protein FWG98_08305 [Candidatus Cloacimonetes bacterium]|nr:hypothetical protein [Candidatus Cloacimonadota bacterium]